MGGVRSSGFLSSPGVQGVAGDGGGHGLLEAETGAGVLGTGVLGTSVFGVEGAHVVVFLAGVAVCCVD